MGTLGGLLLCSATHQVFDGPLSRSAAADGLWGERGYGEGSTLYV